VNGFLYTEFSKGLFDRGNIRNMYEIPKLIEANYQTDCYVNTLLFQESFKTFVSNTDSVKEYRGVAKMVYFPIDIDSSDLDESLNKLRDLLELLNVNDVPTMHMKYYFSGSKGFHVLIPNIMIGASPSESISRYMKKFGKLLLDDLLFDPTIYNHVRLLRCPNTKHQKSGLFKIPITAQEIYLKTIEWFKEKAKEPRFDVVQEKYTGSQIPFLHSLWLEAVNSSTTVYNVSKFKESEQYKFPCHRAIFENGAGEGSRNETALRAAWILKKHSGLTEDLTLAVLEKWNKKNQPPLEIEELTTVIKQAYAGNYNYGCSDNIIKRYCDDSCPLLQKKRLEQKETPAIISFDSMSSEYEDFVDLCAKNPVRFFHPFDNKTRGFFPGFISYIMARSGVGKTSLLIDIIVRMAEHGIKMMFFSLEMPSVMIYERLAARILGVPQSLLPMFVKDKSSASRLKKITHLLSSTLVLTDKPALSIKQMEDYMHFAEERILGSKLDVVMIDYFGLIRPEKETGNEYQDKTKLANEVQIFAKENKIPVICLLQTNRVGEDGTAPITLASGRGSGHIEEATDFMIGVWKQEENVHLKILKNRYGPCDVGYTGIVNRMTNEWSFKEIPKIRMKNL